MTYNERPGVYSSYEVSGVVYSCGGGGVVGIAASAGSGAGELAFITSYTGAVSAFGNGCNLTELIRVLLLNGVSEIKAMPLAAKPGTADYENAFELLAAQEDIKIVLCDSRDAAVHAALYRSIAAAAEKCSHRIGVVESGAADVPGIVARAESLNCERMVMVAPAALNSDGNEAVTGSLAAAAAGAIVSEADPAIPLNGAELYGLGGLSAQYSDGDINALVRGGVTPVETVGGGVYAVRGITTRSMTGGEADATWRELTTVRIIDDVIPAIRNSLKSKFSRSKNTGQTRGAIRTQVIIELENKLNNEIIDSYSNVSVSQSTDDPTVCIVTFEFGVAHGLNQIRLTAYITV